MTNIAKNPSFKNRYVIIHASDIPRLTAFEDASQTHWGEVLVNFINLQGGKQVLTPDQGIHASDLSWGLLVCNEPAPVTFVCYRIQTWCIRQRADD